jgi:hypothetical protein
MRNRSIKNILNLNELVGDKIFILPKTMANDIDLKTGKPCVWVGINGKAIYIPVEEPTPIPYNAFCLLKDNGNFPYQKYTQGEEFKPI